jgi:chaperonin GroEL
MEYNLPSEIVKDINFGDQAQEKIIAGVQKLAKAVKSTLGASGKCVIYEDGRGKPVITKDGVTVAQSVVLFDPIENIGATLIKEAANNTVKEAGDGTTTATVLAESILSEIMQTKGLSAREIKNGVNKSLEAILSYLDEISQEVDEDTLKHVAAISCNNDAELGNIIAEAYNTVGKDGVVLMESSDTEETYVETVDGVQFDSGLTSPHFITNTEKQKAELDNPLILICTSEIPNVRKIQGILEYVIKNNRALLIVAPVSQQVKSALLMNKVKGVIKVNVIDLPGFGPTKMESCEDLAILTGAKLFNEELGDDLDMITPDDLGEADYAETDDNDTVITLSDMEVELGDRVDEIHKRIKDEPNAFIKKKLEERLAMLSGSVGIIKVGANSKVELKEKKDRVEDAIHATKAALKEGIVPGGGIALLNASEKIGPADAGEEILLRAIKAPFKTIMRNAGYEFYPNQYAPMGEGKGINVVTGDMVDMIDAGIIDPVLVTKSALKNAVSVASTITSADCVISNMRINESD